MRHPQLVISETDGLLARRLSSVWEQHRWALREPRRSEDLLELLRQPGPSVLVLKVGRDLLSELSLLARVAISFPDVPVVVVGDAEDPALAGMAWDLGAKFVLFTPLPRDLLEPVVAGLMREAGPTPTEGGP